MIALMNCRWLHELQTCKEDFPEGGRLVYSGVTMLIQYLLPTITISVAYYQILGQLRTRLKQKKSQVLIEAITFRKHILSYSEFELLYISLTKHLISVGRLADVR